MGKALIDKKITEIIKINPSKRLRARTHVRTAKKMIWERDSCPAFPGNASRVFACLPPMARWLADCAYPTDLSNELFQIAQAHCQSVLEHCTTTLGATKDYYLNLYNKVIVVCYCKVVSKRASGSTVSNRLLKIM